MKKLILILGLVILGHWALAQDPGAQQKIQAARIALITERLALSPDQAEKFWPIYREFMDQRRNIQKEFRDARLSLGENASEEERQKLIDLGLDVKQRQLDLEKDYSQRILAVIDSKQLMQLRRAEEDFRRMLLQRLQERQDMQRRRREMKDRYENRQNQRRNN